MEKIQSIKPAFLRTPETSYWETWNDHFGLPQGTIYSSESYQAWQQQQALKEKGIRRMANTSIATGRVNGGFLKGGNKR